MSEPLGGFRSPNTKVTATTTAGWSFSQTTGAQAPGVPPMFRATHFGHHAAAGAGAGFGPGGFMHPPSFPSFNVTSTTRRPNPGSKVTTTRWSGVHAAVPGVGGTAGTFGVTQSEGCDVTVETKREFPPTSMPSSFSGL